jgi:hypothetical protein
MPELIKQRKEAGSSKTDYLKINRRYKRIKKDYKFYGTETRGKI